MYELFVILLFIFSILLIGFIIFIPNENSINNSTLNINNNFHTIITSNFIKKIINSIIIILIILFYIITLILNIIINNNFKKFKIIK